MGSDENKMEPNEWISDEVLPGFRKFSTEFYWECWKTAQNVLRALALGLGLEDENYLLKYHTGHTNELSMKYYPSVPGSELQSHEKERLGAHMDMDCMTLLFQDDCGGLEVEKPEKPGEFVPAEPIENTLVMNVGDVLMWWSNGEPNSFPENVVQVFENFELICQSMVRLFEINHTSGATTATQRPLHGRGANDAKAILNAVLCFAGARHRDRMHPRLLQREKPAQV